MYTCTYVHKVVHCTPMLNSCALSEVVTWHIRSLVIYEWARASCEVVRRSLAMLVLFHCGETKVLYFSSLLAQL